MKTRLKELRIKNKLSVKKLANFLKISVKTYQKYEQDLETIPINIIISLAKFYHTSTDYIVFLTDIYKPFNDQKEEN